MKDQNYMTFEFLVDNSSPTVRDYARRLHKIPQSFDWHPEGNVEVHSKIVLERARKYEDKDLILAAFFHDLGKVDTTIPNEKGGFSAHNHEDISVNLVKYSRSWIKELGGNPDKVEWIVGNHMRVKYLDDMKPKKADELIFHEWFPELYKFKYCDSREGLNVIEVILSGGNPFTYLFNKAKTFLKKKI
jgi:poly(A) polymerase